MTDRMADLSLQPLLGLGCPWRKASILSHIVNAVLHDRRPQTDRQTDRHSYQALHSTGLENYLPEAQGRSQTSLWARLVLYHPASLDLRSQLQPSTQLRLGVLELHEAVGQSEDGGERTTKECDEGQNTVAGREEGCCEEAHCPITRE